LDGDDDDNGNKNINCNCIDKTELRDCLIRHSLKVPNPIKKAHAKLAVFSPKPDWISEQIGLQETKNVEHTMRSTKHTTVTTSEMCCAYKHSRT
jgi:hypothetical protein